MTPQDLEYHIELTKTQIQYFTKSEQDESDFIAYILSMAKQSMEDALQKMELPKNK